MRKIAPCLLWVGILTALALPAFAETRTISWSPVTSYSDGTPIEAGKTVSYSAYWTTDPGLGSLRTIGTSLTTISATFDPGVQGMTRGGTVYFTMKTVLNTGEESALSPASAWVVPVVTPPAVTLSSIAVSGPTSVNEGGTGTYTATGTWSDGTTTAISPTWSENSTYATISTSGVLTASAVTSNQAVTVTATSGGRTSTMSVTIVDVPGTVPVPVPVPAATLSSIAVGGPTSVSEGGTATYTATATWSDGTNTTVTPTWSTNLGTISAAGLFTPPMVTSNQAATVSATYGGRTSTMSVTIVDVPGAVPAAVKNLGITGPILSGTTMMWRLTWTPVTTFTNGTSLAPGRTVRYTVYWSDTPTLTVNSLRELSSGISEPALDFDPLSRMERNRKTYFVVRAILDTGEESPLSAALEWVAANAGPKAPSGGFIKRKH